MCSLLAQGGVVGGGRWAPLSSGSLSPSGRQSGGLVDTGTVFLSVPRWEVRDGVAGSVRALFQVAGFSLCPGAPAEAGGPAGSPTRALIPRGFRLDQSKPLSVGLSVLPAPSLCLRLSVPASHPSVSRLLLPPHPPAMTLCPLQSPWSLLCARTLSPQQD